MTNRGILSWPWAINLQRRYFISRKPITEKFCCKEFPFFPPGHCSGSFFISFFSSNCSWFLDPPANGSFFHATYWSQLRVAFRSAVSSGLRLSALTLPALSCLGWGLWGKRWAVSSPAQRGWGGSGLHGPEHRLSLLCWGHRGSCWLVLLLGSAGRVAPSSCPPSSLLLAPLPLFPGGEANLEWAARSHATLALLGEEIEEGTQLPATRLGVLPSGLPELQAPEGACKGPSSFLHPATLPGLGAFFVMWPRKHPEGFVTCFG